MIWISKKLRFLRVQEEQKPRSDAGFFCIHHGVMACWNSIRGWVMDYKKHPIVIGAAAAISTFGICVTLFFTVILPTWTKELENTVVDQKQQISEFREQIADKDSQIARLEKSADVQTTEPVSANSNSLEANQDITVSSIFSKTDLYPTSYAQVRIGDSIAAIESRYDKNAITQNIDPWVSVKLDDPLFSDVTYYKIYCTYRDIRIDHILFAYKNSRARDAITNKIIKIFGSKSLLAASDATIGSMRLKTPVVARVYAELEEDVGYVIWPMDGSDLCQRAHK